MAGAVQVEANLQEHSLEMRSIANDCKQDHWTENNLIYI